MNELEGLLRVTRVEIVSKLRQAVHQEWWDAVEKLSAAYARLGLGALEGGPGDGMGGTASIGAGGAGTMEKGR